MNVKKTLVGIYGWVQGVCRLFFKCNCSVYAASLTYYSILSVVPVLCILLLLAKTVGLDDFAVRRLPRRDPEKYRLICSPAFFSP